MTFLFAILALAAAFAVEAAVGRLLPGAHRFLDPIMIPVIWYALTRSQRSAMLVGFAGGWLQDAWFQAGLFGINGFSKTLIGWALGGLGARFELNSVPGRAAAGALTVLLDRLLQVGLVRLFDQPVLPVNGVEWSGRAVVGSALTLVVFGLLESKGRDGRRARRRK